MLGPSLCTRKKLSTPWELTKFVCFLLSAFFSSPSKNVVKQFFLEYHHDSNCFDPGHARCIARPDQGPDCLNILMIHVAYDSSSVSETRTQIM